MLIGKSESLVTKGSNPLLQKRDTLTEKRDPLPQNPKMFLQFVLRIVSSFWKKTFVGMYNIVSNCPSAICPHGMTDTCLVYILKVFKFIMFCEIHASRYMQMVKYLIGK